MRRLLGLALLVALGVAATGGTAYPCAAIRASARLDSFACNCDGGEGSLETQIFVVSGSVEVSNNMATPTLGSLVVELQAREAGHYVPVARQLTNATGATSVETCMGTLASGAVETAGPVEGRLALVDQAGNEVSFDDVKQLPDGEVTLRYVATYAGSIPELAPGERARVKVYLTSFNADFVQLCTVDASGDGVPDQDVLTLGFYTLVKVPSVSFLATP
jgi:hypothetical protein